MTTSDIANVGPDRRFPGAGDKAVAGAPLGTTSDGTDHCTPGAGVLTLSADSEEGLRRDLTVLADDLAGRSHEPLLRVCWTSNHTKASLRHRYAVAAADRDTAVATLRTAAAAREPVGGYRADGASPVVGFLFTGQGSQYPGMTRALYAASAAYRDLLAEVDAQMAPHLGCSVRDLVLGDGPDGGASVHRTEFTQPALFAVEYALGRLLLSLGVVPAWLVGHSIGEYAAACLADALPLPDACRLIVIRGRLMGALPAGGRMLAVRAGHRELAGFVRDEPLADVAALNAANATVLSGDAAALERIRLRLAEAKTVSQWLQVSHAFHSPLMEPMLAEFTEAAARSTAAAPKLPVYSTLRGRLLAGEPMDAAYWTEHVRATVRFADAVGTALDTGPTHVIEVGPRPVLSALARQVRPRLPVRWLAMCSGERSEGLEPAETAAALYQDGLDLAWDAFYPQEQRVPVRLAPGAFSAARR